MQYRRFYRQGALYFFTVVTYQRRPILTNTDVMPVLKAAFKTVQQKYPFKIMALVVLPDHLHTIWQMPENDANFSIRWNQIKRYVSHHCKHYDNLNKTTSEIKKRQSSFWQQRFWEHCIRDDEDFANCMDYIHYNPVKHGYVQAAKDWRFSTFHKYVAQDVYPEDWGGVIQDFDYE
ncbi:REP-associated tyrosine transposase [Wielerella bovis]|uniref:REP-associated tyrosine transposase n=1 Tax=Wielerella bovis TaxID=2917790 RepID=UPI002019FF46|nr:transposase [Wielerella bovis]ULJ61508.1 transposase [Wielerella bovis]